MKIKIKIKDLFDSIEEFKSLEFKDKQEVNISDLNLAVDTPDGSAPILYGIVKKNLETVTLELEDGNSVSSATTHILISSDNNNVFAKDVSVGDTIKTRSGLTKVISKSARGVEDCYDITIPSPHLYFSANGVLHHNTIICGAISKMCEEFGRTLIIVPSKSLVTQTEEDYVNLGLDVGVFFGDRKEVGHMHTICTWQSLGSLCKKKSQLEDDEFTIADMIEDVIAVIVDEAHSAKGDVLQEMLAGPLSGIPIRWGLTGTIPKDEVDKVRLLTCIGPVVGNITAKELQDKGVLAKLNINILQLDDSHVEYKTYQDEKSFLTGDTKRLEYMAKLIKTLALEGNTLVLIERIETGEILQSLIPDSILINGSVKNDVRKEGYDTIRDGDNKVIVASYGVAAVGLNIPRIFNLVLIEPGKSFVRVIQSIGRGIRKARDKDHVDIWDITSNLKFSAKHLKARKVFYNEAGYPHQTEKVKYR